MPIKRLNPYLAFAGTAAKAIQLYERALGAKVETLMRFGDVPDHPCPTEHRDRVMHAALRIGDALLMISDAPPDQPAAPAGNVQIMLDVDDLADQARKFEALAAGGRVIVALHDTFWGARFGMLTDAFSIPWMFNCELKTR